MKRVLSLFLAVLMLVGCMTFVASAETAAQTLPEILAENGTEHVTLTSPIAVAPKQDKSIGATEYSVHTSFTVTEAEQTLS